MIETILHGIQKGINAATPWLVGTAAGLFLLWLALLIREKKPFERELKWFAALTPFGKSADAFRQIRCDADVGILYLVGRCQRARRFLS